MQTNINESFVKNKQFLIDNLHYRISCLYPNSDILIGTGSPIPEMMIVESSPNQWEKDATAMILDKLKLTNNTFRSTIHIIEDAEYTINRYYLKELIQLIKPLVVVASGEEAAVFLKGGEIKHKKFSIDDMPGIMFIQVESPWKQRAPAIISKHDLKEWDRIAKLAASIKKQKERAASSV